MSDLQPLGEGLAEYLEGVRARLEAQPGYTERAEKFHRELERKRVLDNREYYLVVVRRALGGTYRDQVKTLAEQTIGTADWEKAPVDALKGWADELNELRRKLGDPRKATP